MATTDDRADQHDLTVAPIVGPDDPRRFTDSGIEVKPLYTEEDLPTKLELGEPGDFPYIRGVHREMYRKQLWTMRQYAGYASAKESNERYRYLLSQGRHRPVDGLRPADAARPGLRQPALPRRGRPHGRRDRHDRRHAHGVRRHPAGPGLDVDDDQRAGRVPAAALRARRRGAGRAERAAARHDAERRAQGVHRARELHLPAGAHDAADDRPLRVLRGEHPEAGTRSRSPATTSARRAARAVQEVAFTLCIGHRLRAGGGRRAAWTSTTSPRAWRSSSTATTTSSRRSRSSAPPGGCGRTSCATASAPRTRSR